MQKFMAVYTGSPDAFERWQQQFKEPEDRKKREQSGIAAWHEWNSKHAGAIVDAGGPLGRTRRVSKSGIAEVRNDLSGYVIVQADSHEAAAKLFENHPHFTLFPGEAVEVMPCLPIPGRS